MAGWAPINNGGWTPIEQDEKKDAGYLEYGAKRLGQGALGIGDAFVGLGQGALDAAGYAGAAKSVGDFRQNTLKPIDDAINKSIGTSQTFITGEDSLKAKYDKGQLKVSDGLKAMADLALTQAPQFAFGAGFGKLGTVVAKGLSGTAFVEAGIAAERLAVAGTELNAAQELAQAGYRGRMAMGQLGGMQVGMVGQETGSIYNDQAEGEKDFGKALAMGVPAGLLEGMSQYHTLGRSGVAGLVEEGLKKQSRLTGKSFLVDGAKTIAEEGGTEGVQTILEEAGAKKGGLAAIPNDIANNTNWTDVGESAIAGAVMGGGMHGVGSVPTAIRQKLGDRRLKRAEDIQAMKAQDEQGAANPIATALKANPLVDIPQHPGDVSRVMDTLKVELAAPGHVPDATRAEVENILATGTPEQKAEAHKALDSIEKNDAKLIQTAAKEQEKLKADAETARKEKESLASAHQDAVNNVSTAEAAFANKQADVEAKMTAFDQQEAELKKTKAERGKGPEKNAKLAAIKTGRVSLGEEMAIAQRDLQAAHTAAEEARIKTQTEEVVPDGEEKGRGQEVLVAPQAGVDVAPAATPASEPIPTLAPEAVSPAYASENKPDSSVTLNNLGLQSAYEAIAPHIRTFAEKAYTKAKDLAHFTKMVVAKYGKKAMEHIETMWNHLKAIQPGLSVGLQNPDGTPLKLEDAIKSKKTAVIGTAGRDAKKGVVYDKVKWDNMYGDVSGRVTKDDHLVSGGAAWADHLAVKAFLDDKVGSLTLHLPAPFANGEFEGPYQTAGNTANYYHKLFKQQTGVDGLKEIQQAIDKGANVTYEPVMPDNKGMKARNAKVAAADRIIAYTHGEDGVQDGGTKHTYDMAKTTDKTHVPIHKIKPPVLAGKAQLVSLVTAGNATTKEYRGRTLYIVNDKAGTKNMAGSTGGALYINRPLAKEAFDSKQFTGAGREQKLAMLKEAGITEEQFFGAFKSQLEFNTMTLAHETFHLENDDVKKYPRKEGKIDLLHPDAVAIEAAATFNVLTDKQKEELGITPEFLARLTPEGRSLAAEEKRKADIQEKRDQSQANTAKYEENQARNKVKSENLISETEGETPRDAFDYYVEQGQYQRWLSDRIKLVGEEQALKELDEILKEKTIEAKALSPHLGIKSLQKNAEGRYTGTVTISPDSSLHSIAGFSRLMVGAHGLYIELNDTIRPYLVEKDKKGNEIGVTNKSQYDMAMFGRAKVYFQTDTVNYADYKPGKVYVAVAHAESLPKANTIVTKITKRALKERTSGELNTKTIAELKQAIALGTGQEATMKFWVDAITADLAAESERLMRKIRDKSGMYAHGTGLQAAKPTALRDYALEGEEKDAEIRHNTEVTLAGGRKDSMEESSDYEGIYAGVEGLFEDTWEEVRPPSRGGGENTEGLSVENVPGIVDDTGRANPTKYLKETLSLALDEYYRLHPDMTEGRVNQSPEAMKEVEELLWKQEEKNVRYVDKIAEQIKNNKNFRSTKSEETGKNHSPEDVVKMLFNTALANGYDAYSVNKAIFYDEEASSFATAKEIPQALFDLVDYLDRLESDPEAEYEHRDSGLTRFMKKLYDKGFTAAETAEEIQVAQVFTDLKPLFQAAGMEWLFIEDGAGVNEFERVASIYFDEFRSEDRERKLYASEQIEQRINVYPTMENQKPGPSLLSSPKEGIHYPKREERDQPEAPIIPYETQQRMKNERQSQQNIADAQRRAVIASKEKQRIEEQYQRLTSMVDNNQQVAAILPLFYDAVDVIIYSEDRNITGQNVTNNIEELIVSKGYTIGDNLKLKQEWQAMSPKQQREAVAYLLQNQGYFKEGDTWESEKDEEQIGAFVADKMHESDMLGIIPYTEFSLDPVFLAPETHRSPIATMPVRNNVRPSIGELEYDAEGNVIGETEEEYVPLSGPQELAKHHMNQNQLDLTLRSLLTEPWFLNSEAYRNNKDSYKSYFKAARLIDDLKSHLATVSNIFNLFKMRDQLDARISKMTMYREEMKKLGKETPNATEFDALLTRYVDENTKLDGDISEAFITLPLVVDATNATLRNYSKAIKPLTAGESGKEIGKLAKAIRQHITRQQRKSYALLQLKALWANEVMQKDQFEKAAAQFNEKVDEANHTTPAQAFDLFVSSGAEYNRFLSLLQQRVDDIKNDAVLKAYAEAKKNPGVVQKILLATLSVEDQALYLKIKNKELTTIADPSASDTSLLKDEGEAVKKDVAGVDEAGNEVLHDILPANPDAKAFVGKEKKVDLIDSLDRITKARITYIQNLESLLTKEEKGKSDLELQAEQKSSASVAKAKEEYKVKKGMQESAAFSAIIAQELGNVLAPEGLGTIVHQVAYKANGMKSIDEWELEYKYVGLKAVNIRNPLLKAFLGKVAGMFGADLITVKHNKTFNGRYIPSGSDGRPKIVVNMTSVHSIARIFAHELFHHLLNKISDKAYQKFKDAVIDNVSQDQWDAALMKLEEERNVGFYRRNTFNSSPKGSVTTGARVMPTDQPVGAISKGQTEKTISNYQHGNNESRSNGHIYSSVQNDQLTPQLREELEKELHSELFAEAMHTEAFWSTLAKSLEGRTAMEAALGFIIKHSSKMMSVLKSIDSSTWNQTYVSSMFKDAQETNRMLAAVVVEALKPMMHTNGDVRGLRDGIERGFLGETGRKVQTSVATSYLRNSKGTKGYRGVMTALEGWANAALDFINDVKPDSWFADYRVDAAKMRIMQDQNHAGNAAAQEAAIKMKPYMHLFADMNDKDLRALHDSISREKNPKKQKEAFNALSPEMQEAFTKMGEYADALHQQLVELGLMTKDQYRANHFGQTIKWYHDSGKAVDDSLMAFMGGSRLEGNDSMTESKSKRSTDEIAASGLKYNTIDPISMFTAYVEDATKMVTLAKTLKRLEEAGYMKRSTKTSNTITVGGETVWNGNNKTTTEGQTFFRVDDPAFKAILKFNEKNSGVFKIRVEGHPEDKIERKKAPALTPEEQKKQDELDIFNDSAEGKLDDASRDIWEEYSGVDKNWLQDIREQLADQELLLEEKGDVEYESYTTEGEDSAPELDYPTYSLAETQIRKDIIDRILKGEAFAAPVVEPSQQDKVNQWLDERKAAREANPETNFRYHKDENRSEIEYRTREEAMAAMEKLYPDYRASVVNTGRDSGQTIAYYKLVEETFHKEKRPLTIKGEDGKLKKIKAKFEFLDSRKELGTVATEEEASKRAMESKDKEGTGRRIKAIPVWQEAQTTAEHSMFFEKDIAKLMNVILSQDAIRGSKYGNKIMGWKNTLTMAELALSPFHWMTITQELVASSAALARNEVGLINKIKAFNPRAGFERSRELKLFFEKVIGDDAYRNSSEAKAEMLRLVGSNDETAFDVWTRYAQNGGMFHQDVSLRAGIQSLGVSHQTDEKGSFSRQQAFKSIAETNRKIHESQPNKLLAYKDQTLFHMTVTPTAYLMEEVIPRVKFAAFAREYALAISKAKSQGITVDEAFKSDLARSTMKFVEDRFGEVNWKNMWLSRTNKTILQAVFRSFTWVAGSWKAMAKSGLDLFKYGWFKVKYVGTEEKYELADKGYWGLMAIATHLATVKIIQAALAPVFALQAGDGEDDDESVGIITKMLFPRTDKNDNTKRMAFGSYPGEVFKYLSHLGIIGDSFSPAKIWTGRLAGPITTVYETLWSNETFDGVTIRDSDDPFYIQIKDVAVRALSTAVPMSVGGAVKELVTNGPTQAAGMKMAGFTNAPASTMRSRAANVAFETGRQEYKGKKLTDEDMDLRNSLKRAMREWTLGDKSSVRALLAEGAISKRQLDIAITRYPTLDNKPNPLYQDQLSQALKRLTVGGALKVYSYMTEAERIKHTPEIMKKISNMKLRKDTPLQKQKELIAKWKEMRE